MAAGTLKIQDVQTLFHFTEKSTGLGLAACNQNTITIYKMDFPKWMKGRMGRQNQCPDSLGEL